MERGNCAGFAGNPPLTCGAPKPTLRPASHLPLFEENSWRTIHIAPRRARPLSPFSIYRWPVTMATSITHRVTGLGLSIGHACCAWWLIAVASGPDAYGPFTSFAGEHRSARSSCSALPGRWPITCCNGIRHLAWDLGYGFDLRTAHWTGIARLRAFGPDRGRRFRAGLYCTGRDTSQ